MRALLIGTAPDWDLGHTYVTENYEGVVIGSMSLSQLLCFTQEQVLSALAEGKPVVLYTPEFPTAPGVNNIKISESKEFITDKELRQHPALKCSFEVHVPYLNNK